VLPLGGLLNAVRTLVRSLPLSLPAPIIIRCVTEPWMQFSFDLLAFFLPALNVDVIAPPTDAEGGLFSEINDNSVQHADLRHGPHPARWRRRGERGVHGWRFVHRPSDHH
jgi:hypothetical protein